TWTSMMTRSSAASKPSVDFSDSPGSCEPGSAPGPASRRLDHDGRAVAEHLGHSRHEFGGVVTHADDCVGAEHAGLAQHELVGFRPGLFAERGVYRDVAAEQRMQSADEIADNGARTHGQA